MKTKSANKLFLLFTLIGGIFELVFSSSVSFLEEYSFGSIIRYLIFIIIGLVMIKKDGGSVMEVLPYNVPLKFRTLLLIVVSVFMFMPLASVLSWASSNWFGNIFQYASQTSLFDPSDGFRLVFTIGIVPAIFEEINFRGFFYTPYRDARGPRFAILLSAFLFGIFHMNFQQALYAIYQGIIIGILRELTGSMWAGTLYHFINNGFSAYMSHLCYKSETIKEIFSFIPSSRMDFSSTPEIVYSLVLTVIYTTLGFVILRRISQIEGKEEEYLSFFKSDVCNNDKVLTPALVIGIIFAFIVMIGLAFLLTYFGDSISANLANLAR